MRLDRGRQPRQGFTAAPKILDAGSAHHLAARAERLSGKCGMVLCRLSFGRMACSSRRTRHRANVLPQGLSHEDSSSIIETATVDMRLTFFKSISTRRLLRLRFS